jgi:hypothetical protein
MKDIGNNGDLSFMDDLQTDAQYQLERERDSGVSRGLDRIYERFQKGLDQNEEDIEDILEEDDIPEVDNDDELEMPNSYMPPRTSREKQDSCRERNDISREDITPNMEFPDLTTVVPTTDFLENPFLRVVHTNGVHHIAVIFCSCRGRENTHCDVMAQRLVPTSFIRYRTMFTHAVLDDFRLANLECKSSAYHYFQKLRRQTSPMSPDSVPNLYHELRRMSRAWRWMKKLKWAGFGHGTEQPTNTIESGVLANFCPACPQPGINLPAEWHTDPQRYKIDIFYYVDK